MSEPLDYYARLAKAALPRSVPSMPPDAPAPGTTRPHEPPPHPEAPTSAALWADINRQALALVESGEAKDFQAALAMVREQHPEWYNAYRHSHLHSQAGINRPGISAADAAGIPGAMGKQAPPDKQSVVWTRLLTEARVKFHTGLAPDMPTALGMAAKQFPALYEQYRQEQLAQCGVGPVSKSIPPAPAPAALPPEVAELETRIAKVLDKDRNLSRPQAWSKVMQSPDAQALYKSYRERTSPRRS
jgi:hypothetical protein